jgi:hypothetical protein
MVEKESALTVGAENCSGNVVVGFVGRGLVDLVVKMRVRLASENDFVPSGFKASVSITAIPNNKLYLTPAGKGPLIITLPMHLVNGLLVYCDPVLKEIYMQLDNEFRFIIEDLDANHLFVKEEAFKPIQKRVKKALIDGTLEGILVSKRN